MGLLFSKQANTDYIIMTQLLDTVRTGGVSSHVVLLLSMVVHQVSFKFIRDDEVEVSLKGKEEEEEEEEEVVSGVCRDGQYHVVRIPGERKCS